ncbi:MAG: hypothetical protein ACR2GD_14280, partial [Pyrinomonadaceae bacterium]
MQTKLEKKVYYLQIYCAVITLLLGSIFVFGFAVQQKQKFGEIDVERINVVEKDGKLRMVISNKELQHPGMMDGKYYKEREGQREAGITFFSEKGDEIGGLIFGGDTGKGQFGSLTFDKFRGDQTIQLTHDEDADGKYFAGLKMNDENISLPDRLSKIEEIEKLPTREEQMAAKQKMRDNGEFLVTRLSIGRSRDKSAILKMSDAKGRPRIQMSVAADGNPKLNFLDETGKVIY